MKIWNGTEFVDPTGYKVWNGTAFVDPKEIHTWDGTQFVKQWPTAPEEIRFLGANSATGVNSDPAAMITVSEPATLILAGCSNTSSKSLSVNGATATSLGSIRNLMMAYLNVPAGTHVASFSASGSYRSVCVSAYAGITAVNSLPVTAQGSGFSVSIGSDTSNPIDSLALAAFGNSVTSWSDFSPFNAWTNLRAKVTRSDNRSSACALADGGQLPLACSQSSMSGQQYDAIGIIVK